MRLSVKHERNAELEDGLEAYMDWTHFAMLSAGLGIGAGVGWLVGRSRSTPSTHVDTEVAAPASSVVNRPDLHSEVHTLTEQLQRTQLAYQMAREMEQFKAGFLARTSHELRSPINSVISLHQLILADLAEDPAEEREFIAQASQSAQKMLALLDQLIKISKAMHGTETLQLRSLDLQDVLAELEQFAQLQARNRNVRLQIEYPDADLFVLADPDWLRQSLLSLIDIPISVMQEGSIRLTSQADRETQQLHILIEDQRPASFWCEPVDLVALLQSKQASVDATPKSALLETARSSVPTPGLTLLMTQTLLELMGGRLEILSVPAVSIDVQTNDRAALTRIQCTLPLSS